MKIFLDNCAEHVAVQRMLPVWQEKGVGWSVQPNGCTVQLSLISVRTRAEMPLVFRVDGIYYDAATDYKKRNLKISKGHSQADGVVYQGEFCKRMCRQYLEPQRKGGFNKVIYNGIEKGWCGPFLAHKGYNILVAAKWRRHKRLREITEVFRAYYEANPAARLHVVGDTVENELISHPGIFYYGHLLLSADEARSLFAMADVFVHISKRDCCPNAVIEAIGAGVPVITSQACGGTVELCEKTKNCIVVPESTGGIEPCCHYTDSYNMLPAETHDGVVAALDSIHKMRSRVEQPEELGIECMAGRYLGVFEDVCALF